MQHGVDCKGDAGVSDGQHLPIEEMEVFRRFVQIADRVWEMVEGWRPLAAETVGKQLVRSLDGIGANLVEGDGRYGMAESIHFFVIARASAREARYWLNRAVRRRLISRDDADREIAGLTSATQLLNRSITYRRKVPKHNQVREGRAVYHTTDDPFIEG
jgi:four helix bundle protein